MRASFGQIKNTLVKSKLGGEFSLSKPKEFCFASAGSLLEALVVKRKMRSVGRRVFHITTDVKQQSAGIVLTEKANCLSNVFAKNETIFASVETNTSHDF